MIVDKAGEVICDMLTISPGLSAIPSASAILDASNFTFQAVSFGKDADGFRFHAHRVLDFTPSSDNIIKVISYESSTVSSYHTSATASALQYYYKLLPDYPSPLDTRLERRSTSAIIFSADVGHCMNSVISPSLSSYSNLIGCFAPSSGRTYWIIKDLGSYDGLDASNFILYSGTLSGAYNTLGLMDCSGFLTIAPLNGSQGKTASLAAQYTSGALLVAETTFSSTGRVSVVVPLSAADAGTLLLYGGVYSIGLWCLDLKEMLREGHKPPFNFNALNNIRKYRLFAKKVFSQDLLYMNDALGLPGFKTFFENKLGWTGTPAAFYSLNIGFL